MTFIYLRMFMSGGEEIEFQEIKTGDRHYHFEKLIMRSKLLHIFRRSELSLCKIEQEIENALGALWGIG
jgi:hypothetical protein